MDNIKGSQKRRAGALLLTILFGLGLALLVLPAAAESGAATLWSRQYPIPEGSYRNSTGLKVDRQGNVYVCGMEETANNRDSAFIIKYSPSGKRFWVKHFLLPGETYFAKVVMVLDSQGNICVAGSAPGSRRNNFIRKMSPEGQWLWVRTVNIPGILTAITVDSQDNIYTTGYSGVGPNTTCYHTVKYGSNGRRLWVRRYQGAEVGPNLAGAITVDDQDNVYVTGYSNEDINPDFYLTTIKYSPEGRRLWLARTKAQSFEWELQPVFMIAVNRQNCVSVLSKGYSMAGSLWQIVKYTPEGQLLWDKHDRKWGNGGAPGGLAMDDQGQVYVAGEYYDSPEPRMHTYYSVTIKFSSDGQILWERNHNDRGAAALALDREGNVYISGSGMATKYAPDGQILWEYRHNLGFYIGIHCCPVEIT